MDSKLSYHLERFLSCILEHPNLPPRDMVGILQNYRHRSLQIKQMLQPFHDRLETRRLARRVKHFVDLPTAQV